MFKKLIELCTFKKEKLMSPTTTESASRTTRQLKKQISDQSSEISKLRSRVSDLVDEIGTLKSEISTFRDRVANDMQVVFESLKNR